jgi:hypothetical protein
MRRALLGLAAMAVLAGCQDRQHPLEPSRFQSTVTTGDALSGNVWIRGVQQYSLPDGTECVFEEGANGEPGLKCGDGDVVSIKDFESNGDLYPVVEVCRLNAPGGDCLNRKQWFIRPLVKNQTDEPGEEQGEGEIRVTGDGMYMLQLNKYFRGSGSADTYRIIIGITFTGLSGNTPIPGWDRTSGKVLAHYEVTTRANGTVQHPLLQFRIRRGTLCEQNPGACVETSIEPGQETTLVFDDKYQQTIPGGFGILGMKFPKLPEELTNQARINIIIERVRLDPGEKCIDAPGVISLTSGREIEPCYRVRSEPFIDLTSYNGLYKIQFGVCVSPQYDEKSGLSMLKWSEVKQQVTDLDLFFENEPFFLCPDEHDPADPGSWALAPATSGWSGFALRTGSTMRSLASLLGPQPVHASRLFGRSPANGSLMDFSRIAVYEPSGYQAHFMSPVGNADPAGMTQAVPSAPVTVTVCPVAGGACTNLDEVQRRNDSYTVNWNAERASEGDYRLTVNVGDTPAANAADVRLRSGRTVPIRFFLTSR